MRAHPNNFKNEGEKFIPCFACDRLVLCASIHVTATTSMDIAYGSLKSKIIPMPLYLWASFLSSYLSFQCQSKLFIIIVSSVVCNHGNRGVV